MGKHTSSTKLVTEKTLELFERIVNKKLLTRRLTITANHLLTEEEAKANAGAEQLTLFDMVEDIEKNDADEEKEKRRRAGLRPVPAVSRLPQERENQGAHGYARRADLPAVRLRRDRAG